MSDFYEGLPVAARLDAYTEEGIDTAEVVDDLLEWSDGVTNNIFHAIEGTSRGEVWAKGENGLYAKQEEAAPVAEAKAPVIEVFTGAVALNGVKKPDAQVVQLDEERTRRRAGGAGALGAPRVAAR